MNKRMINDIPKLKGIPFNTFYQIEFGKIYKRNNRIRKPIKFMYPWVIYQCKYELGTELTSGTSWWSFVKWFSEAKEITEQEALN